MNPVLNMMIYALAAIGSATTSYMTLTVFEFRKRKKMKRPDLHKMWEMYEKNQAQKDA